MDAVKGYFFVTLWRAILKLITITILGYLLSVHRDSPFVRGAFLGASVLWVVDGCDHGIDNIRRRSKQKQTSALSLG